MNVATTVPLPIPLGLLAELTHRCPLACPYCSNPLALETRDSELSAAEWTRVFREAAGLGVLQLHLSGGEPGARRDLTEITHAAHEAGLYTNLITSAIGFTRDRLAELRAAGLDHVQISIQDTEPAASDRIAGYDGAHARKLAIARTVAELGLALTINVVLHRANIARLRDLVGLAAALGAGRVELAHARSYGWALRNREALMPTRAQVEAATADLAAMRARYAGTLAIDAVVPDYYARRPKPCMGGWGRRSLNVTPSGRVLPCHAAETIPGLRFWSVRDRSLADLDPLPRVSGVPRHRLDARAVPVLRAAGDRFRGMPVPGHADRGGCGGSRSRLRAVALARQDAGDGRRGGRRRRRLCLSRTCAPRSGTGIGRRDGGGSAAVTSSPRASERRRGRTSWRFTPFRRPRNRLTKRG